jgi:cell division protein FtsI/penicillin-binding protein 2
MLGRTDRRLRLVALLVAFLVLAGALGARLAYWQVVRGADLQEIALSQLETRTEVPLARGEIFDRSGTAVLATNAYRDLLAAFPAQIPKDQREVVARRLAKILGLEGRAATRLGTALRGKTRYVVLQRQLTQVQSAAVRAGIDKGTLPGLRLEPRPIRFYPSPGGSPDSTLASHLLGFVNSEGRGQYGIEQRYQNVLAGRPRVLTAARDVGGRNVGDTSRVADAGRPGTNLRLTIDASLQLQLEKELYAAWVGDGAASVSALVLDPDTGQVLAWGSVPGYDGNRYQRIAKEQPAGFVDPVASKVYEPGSVMKMVTAAAAYERGVVRGETPIEDSGKLQIGDRRVDDSDKRAMGWIPFRDVIAYSRNVGAARVAMMLAQDTRASSAALFEMWNKLGIGQRTGVDVAGEVNGIVVDPQVKAWAEIDLANRSFGQGVGVTPVQLAVAFSAMVNGGLRVRPHLVAAIGDEETKPPTPAPVLNADLSAELRRLMAHVVNEVPQYAKGTLIPGYVVGGKTGTAQIWDPRRNDWEPDVFNFSFVGFVGQSGPEAVIAVQIHRARPLIRGQGDFQLPITSYQLFRRIAVDTIGALDIPPGQPGQAIGAAGP